jgi:hypothetical protein
MAHSSYKPKSELFKAFPEMQALSKEANDVMEGAEETLSEREFAGCDTSWARAHLYEAEWRITCTSDYQAAQECCRAAEGGRCLRRPARWADAGLRRQFRPRH